MPSFERDMTIKDLTICEKDFGPENNGQVRKFLKFTSCRPIDQLVMVEFFSNEL